MTKKIYLIIGSMLVVALLAGSAFMALRLLKARDQNSASGGDKSLNIAYIPSPELPKQTADLSARVLGAKDQSVFVVQADLDHISVRRLLQQPTPAGPSTEVVVSKDTRIYRDATYDTVPTSSGASSGGAAQRIQQRLDSVDLSAITANSYVQVWGQRRGDRLMADVIVVVGVVVVKNGSGK
jgi:hypothetical protein